MVLLGGVRTIFVLSGLFSLLASRTAWVAIGMGSRTISVPLGFLNMIYFFVYGSLLLCGVISSDHPDVRRFFYLFWLFFLFIFAGFRFEVGCDWDGYRNIFEQLRYVDVFDAAQRREPLFEIANTLLHRYELEYPYINVICSFIFFLGMHRLAKREPDPYGILVLSFPVLVINLPMSGIRQAAATNRRGAGYQCRAPAVRGSNVCRMHGAAGGAPKGNRNALKHGGFTAETLALRKEVQALAQMARETMAAIE